MDEFIPESIEKLRQELNSMTLDRDRWKIVALEAIEEINFLNEEAEKYLAHIKLLHGET